MKEKMLTGVSLFSGAGIDEQYIEDAGVKIIAANELLRICLNLFIISCKSVG